MVQQRELAASQECFKADGWSVIRLGSFPAGWRLPPLNLGLKYLILNGLSLNKSGLGLE